MEIALYPPNCRSFFSSRLELVADHLVKGDTAYLNTLRSGQCLKIVPDTWYLGGSLFSSPAQRLCSSSKLTKKFLYHYFFYPSVDYSFTFFSHHSISVALYFPFAHFHNFIFHTLFNHDFCSIWLSLSLFPSKWKADTIPKFVRFLRNFTHFSVLFLASREVWGTEVRWILLLIAWIETTEAGTCIAHTYC